MRKEVFAVLLVAIALAVAGCKGSGEGAVSSSSTPFIGGTEGLRASFVENAPPAETLDNPKPADTTAVTKFSIVLRLENVGEQKIPKNALKTTLGGIYAADFGKVTADFTSNSKEELEGVRKDPEGGKITGGLMQMEFNDLYYAKSLEGNNEFPIQADVCYTYQTKAVGDFCMRQNALKATSGVCSIKGAKPVFSSAGPIHITSLEEAVGGSQKVVLRFTIKAVGAGSFYLPTTATSGPTCERGNFQEENSVMVTVKTGVSGLQCSGGGTFTNSGDTSTGKVRLSNGEASVTCFQSGINVDAIKKANIYLDYNHLISVSTKLLVKHLPSDGSDSSGGGSSGSSSGGSSSGGQQQQAATTSGVGTACSEEGKRITCPSDSSKEQRCLEGKWQPCYTPLGAIP